MKHRPIEHCYWVVENKFLAGEYPRTKEADSSQKKLDALVNAGITLFIDLTEETEDLLPYSNCLTAHKEISHRRFPICDVSIPRSKKMTIGILDAIDAEISNSGMVYVHCWGGVGRTGGSWVPGWRGIAAMEKLLFTACASFGSSARSHSGARHRRKRARKNVTSSTGRKLLSRNRT